MVLDKSCPGSRSIREPRPEYINCPDCHTEVEVWTDELKATCPRCGRQVFRVSAASCIDWCPHAKECVGPEVYERLKPGMPAESSSSDSPLTILEREHERALEMLGLLQGASLCLKLGAFSPASPIWERGIDHLAKVLDFWGKDLELHFRREEEVLFPVLEKHLGAEKSPTRLLRQEHQAVWQHYHELKEKLVQMRTNGSQPSAVTAEQIQEIGGRLRGLLPAHIKKENESLFPLARGLLSNEELESTAQSLRRLSP